MKKSSSIIKSVIALSGVAVACVAILSIANTFLQLSPEEAEERRIAFLHSIILAESFVVLHDLDNEEKSAVLKDFNGRYSEYIMRVYAAKGGANDGIYIIESKAAGYNGFLTVMVVYNSDGTVRLVSIKESPPQEFISKISFEMLNLLLRGRSGNVGGVQDFDAAGSGATKTLSGVVAAVNLANRFYEKHL